MSASPSSSEDETTLRMGSRAKEPTQKQLRFLWRQLPAMKTALQTGTLDAFFEQLFTKWFRRYRVTKRGRPMTRKTKALYEADFKEMIYHLMYERMCIVAPHPPNNEQVATSSIANASTIVNAGLIVNAGPFNVAQDAVNTPFLQSAALQFQAGMASGAGAGPSSLGIVPDAHPTTPSTPLNSAQPSGCRVLGQLATLDKIVWCATSMRQVITTEHITCPDCATLDPQLL